MRIILFAFAATLAIAFMFVLSDRPDEVIHYSILATFEKDGEEAVGSGTWSLHLKKRQINPGGNAMPYVTYTSGDALEAVFPNGDVAFLLKEHQNYDLLLDCLNVIPDFFGSRLDELRAFNGSCEDRDLEARDALIENGRFSPQTTDLKLASLRIVSSDRSQPHAEPVDFARIASTPGFSAFYSEEDFHVPPCSNTCPGF